MAETPFVVTVPASSREPAYFFVEAFADPTSLGIAYALVPLGDPQPGAGVYQAASWTTDVMYPNRAPVAETDTTPARRGRYLARGDVGAGSNFPLTAGVRYGVWARLTVSVNEIPVMLAGIVDAI
jgi:hypothetical protein